MLLDLFNDSIRYYPKGTLLIIIALINILVIVYIFLSKKKYTDAVFKFYLFYSCFTLLWVISNAYFQSKFLFALGENMAKYMAISANMTSSFAIISFYGFTSLMRQTKKKITSFSWGVMIFLVLVTLIFNLVPGLAINEVHIFAENAVNAKFELIFSKWNFIYFFIGLVTLFVSFKNFGLALKNAHDRIENIRLYYILFGISLMYGSLALFIIVFPQLLNNYDYVWIPPFLSIIHVLIIGYAIAIKRFLDIRLLISKLFKFTISFTLAVVIPFILIKVIIIGFPNASVTYLYIIGVTVVIFVFNKMMKFFNSYTFYSYFGSTNAEHFRYIANELKNKKQLYTFVKDYESYLQKAFSTKMKKIVPQIIVIDNSIKKKYPKLISYFKKNKGILVTEEIKFTGDRKDKIVPFLKELESLGGICMPLYHASKGLVGLFTLGEKTYNHMYSKEAITALEDIGSYLSFILTGIIYNNELEADVALKTAKLRNQIQEINEVLYQQSDFIAVTAHEFRTPLSIAMFQLDEVMKSKKNTKGAAEDLKVIDSSLENLKKLTQNLFDVQRYDLDKVKVCKERTNIKKFLNEIFADFSVFMKNKSLRFAFEDELKEEIYCDIDKAQMRQAFSNILANSAKFAKKRGTVILHAKKIGRKLLLKVSDNGKGVPDEYKESIFEKFKTNSEGSGIGLGLYICKKIIELHKGKIWVDDSELGGAMFCIELNIK